jgi:hypothetical protein
MEQVKNSNNSSSNKSSKKSNLKKIFWWAILWTLLLTSCQDNKSTKSDDVQELKIEDVADGIIEDINEPIDIQKTREYKIYKLWLGSIVPIKWDIQRAKVKISNTPELSNILTWKDVEFETIMPSIIKESMMNNAARSNSWAVWYFQLKPIAVKDVVDNYKIGNLKLDVNNPVDNVILWSLYRKRSMNLLKQWLGSNLSDTDLEKMMILSYNAWPARIKTLFKESKAKNYNEFEKFLAKRIWVRKSPTKKIDKTYWVDYTDPLTDINFDLLKNREERKIAEWLRYVAIIDGISSYIKENQTIQILWKVTSDENTTLFSTVKKLREQWLFKKNASINDICKIILETNGFKDTETPKNTVLILVKEPLQAYLSEEN